MTPSSPKRTGRTPGAARRGRSLPRLDRTLVLRLLLAVAALGVFGVIVAAGAWFRVCSGEGACPSIAGLTSYDPLQASKVYAADGRLITDFGTERRTVISLDRMAPALPAAFLAVEDRRFYEHGGVDWFGVLAAVKDRLIGSSRGASTITMQLAGNLWPEEIDRRQRGGIAGITRKIREAKVATQIEARYAKDKVLELYLNKIYLGNGAYGVESAAQRYFGKHAAEINVAEAAMLVALAKGPGLYDPRLHPDNAVARRNLVLGLMRDAGMLTTEETETWRAYPIALVSRSDFQGVGRYFVEYVRQQLEARLGSALYEKGYRIYTTLDLNAQAAAERALAAQLERIEAGDLGTYRHQTYRDYLEQRGSGAAERSTTPYLQGAVVVLEARTGNILAMVGGRDFDDSKFNRAVQAERQPGSTFKPIVYSAALEAGIPLERVEMDTSISIPIPDQPNWEPSNYNGRFSDQPMTLRQALWASTNTVAVQVGLEVGLPSLIDEARKFGLTGRIPAVPSLTLGSLDVRPIEMVAAYTTFANLGIRAEPNAILRVENDRGEVEYETTPVRRRVLPEVVAWTMTDALKGVVQHGSGNAVWQAGFRFPAGGKTGTTNDYNNVWFIGFTSDIVAGVWMGFDQLTPIMSNAQGGRLAAPAWAGMMQEIYQRRSAPADWPQPANLMRSVEIDITNGFRATPFCPREYVEMRSFPPGGEPTEYCPIHTPFGPGQTD